MQPGIYKGLDIDEYHRGPGVSKSALSQFMKSPAHYQQYMADMTREKTAKELDTLRLGRATHLAILEPEKYAPLPVWEGTTRRGKEWTSFINELEGRDYILGQEKAIINAMAMYVHANKFAASLLDIQGCEEESCFWYDSQSGELCKCRPDRRRTDKPFVIDYKTCVDSSPEGFSKSIAKFGYHIQAAMVFDGYKSNGIELEHFFFIAQEKTAPFNVEVYDLSPRAIAQGEQEYKEALLNFAQCKIEKNWHGYTDQQLTEIDLPAWAR